MVEFIVLSGVFMNKKIIGLALTIVFVSFGYSFAMDGFAGFAPNDPSLIEYYFEIFKKEEQERKRLAEEQAQAKKERANGVPSHDDQMKEYVAKHRRNRAKLQNTGEVVIVAQSDGQDGNDAVVELEMLLNDCSLSNNQLCGSVIPKKKLKRLRGAMIGKRDDSSRPAAQDPDPKRRPLLELIEKMAQLSIKQNPDPVAVVIQSRESGKKRAIASRQTDEADDPNAKKQKGN